MPSVINKDLISYKRVDLVLKIFIRTIRRKYYELFNEATGFVKRKRYKKKNFYPECMDEFIGMHFPDH